MRKLILSAGTALAALAAAGAQSMSTVATPTMSEFEIKPLPVSCRLQPKEFRQREETLLAALAAAVRETRPLADGYALLLAPDEKNLRLAAEIITAESLCCPFLEFRLTMAQDRGALALELRGPAGTTALLRELLHLP